MLSELQIENIAVIEKAAIPFENGLNIMTGETGAGKSIVIDSIHAVLGERTSRELIRTGCETAFVSALFYDNRPQIRALLEEHDIPTEEDGTILISRRMTAEGRNLCKINGATVTVSTVKQIAKELINIHGQADNQSLLNAENHLSYIDSIAQNESFFEAYQTAFRAYKEAKKKYTSMQMDETEKLRRLDILNYQIEELESAEIQVGETAEITEKLALLRNAERITDTLHESYALLNGDGEAAGAAALAMQAVSQMEALESFTSEYAAITAGLREAAYNLEAFCDELREGMDADFFDEGQAEVLEERLDLLAFLRRKYGETEEEMLAFLKNAKQEQEAIVLSDETREKLLQEMHTKYETAESLALQLRKSRLSAAKQFEKNVSDVLAFLDMPSVTFTIVHRPLEKLTATGLDEIEFLLSANAGAPPKPLSKIASGGELSRIMLAVKSVLAEKDTIATLIFDEIDTGVSGRAAQKIAIQLSRLAQSHQIICITHLAQIAAFGDTHFRIQKFEKNGQTYTELQKLDFEGRKAELARIMGGLTVTELQLQNAEELLKNAKS